ncbi:cytochrome c biogenesis heme-transporting ATPase CcmA [Pseudocitrobacter faecalis]|uniref:cytochrome c biogenesis heme-transporting ATPase CcmA n=1 Tax=Pseudocitrobacter faecalis TaxID=1398493 RepID=UPI003BA2C971
MLQANQLTCVYEERVLFESLSFTVEPGEVVQIAGENGSGKTSLLRLLTGLTQPESGYVCWQGERLSRVRDTFHQQMLWIGHKPGVKASLTADENLRLFYPRSTLEAREAALLAIGLAGFEDLPLYQLSAGQQRRSALARLWLSDAALWILDEPLAALDVAAIETLTHRLEKHVHRGGSVVLTTHQPLRSLDCPLRVLRLSGGEAYAS